MSVQQIYYECLECGHRDTAESEPLICEYCGDAPHADETNTRKIEPVPNNSVRVYCEDCDFETTVHEGDAKWPRHLVEGRRNLHQSTGHSARIEYNSTAIKGGDEQRTGVCPPMDNEDELQEWLESYFEKNGWTAIREVSPHRSDYKADLLVKHDDFGWMGIECKYFDHDGGSKIAKAHHQIVSKYRGEKYLKNNRINLWAIAPYFTGIDETSGYYRNQQTLRQEVIREMFCSHGIGIIKLNRPSLLIDFAYSNTPSKIPVEQNSRYHDQSDVDIDHIREIVADKMEQYEY